MRFLRKGTARVVSVGPFFDATNGVSLENQLTISNERISFVVDDGSTGAPVVAVDNLTGSTSHANNPIDYASTLSAMMKLRLDSTNTNYLGSAMLTVTDNSTFHCPVFHEFTILPQGVYDAIVGDTDRLQVDAQEIGSSALSTLAGHLFAYAVESTFTFLQSQRLQNAAAAAKASGSSGSTTTFRDLADTLDRIKAVTDTNGNRTTLTYNLG